MTLVALGAPCGDSLYPHSEEPKEALFQTQIIDKEMVTESYEV